MNPTETATLFFMAAGALASGALVLFFLRTERLEREERREYQRRIDCAARRAFGGE